MALIVEYHVIADMYPIASTTAISAGMLVALDTNGFATQAGSSSGASVIGIAGDSNLTSPGQTTAYSAQVVTGHQTFGVAANKKWTSNRVSDFYNETLAAGKITVYNGGGKFRISDDLYTAASFLTPGTAMFSGSAGTYATGTVNGSTSCVVAITAGIPATYSSGVPGVETTDGSIAIKGGTAGTNYWLPIVLRV